MVKYDINICSRVYHQSTPPATRHYSRTGCSRLVFLVWSGDHKLTRVMAPCAKSLSGSLLEKARCHSCAYRAVEHIVTGQTGMIAINSDGFRRTHQVEPPIFYRMYPCGTRIVVATFRGGKGQSCSSHHGTVLSEQPPGKMWCPRVPFLVVSVSTSLQEATPLRQTCGGYSCKLSISLIRGAS